MDHLVHLTLSLTLISTPAFPHGHHIFCKNFYDLFVIFCQILGNCHPLCVITVTKYYLVTAQKPVHTIVYWSLH